MDINIIYGQGYDSNIYIIKGEIPTIIDCGTGMRHTIVLKDIKKIIDPSNLKQIIITHEHFDHWGGIIRLHKFFNKNVKIITHEHSAIRIERGKSEFNQILIGQMPRLQIDKKIKNEEKIKIGNSIFEVIHTPGHSPGGICLYDKKSKSLISGDSIFANGFFGRYDLPEGNKNQLKTSIEKLSKLDIENIFPGHNTIVKGDGNKHMKMVLQNSKTL
jgi:hydroxyacylglutathione hydrolase